VHVFARSCVAGTGVVVPAFFAVDFGSVFASFAPGHPCMTVFACPQGHPVGAAVVAELV